MKILSVEIGYSRTILCEVDTQNRRVSNMFVIPTPDHVLDDGMLRNDDSFANELRDALDTRGIKTKQVVFTVTGNRIASRDVEIPYVKRNMIAEVLKTNQADYFPMDLRNYRVAYTILEVLKQQGKESDAADLEVVDIDEEIEEELGKKGKKKRKKLEKKKAKLKAKEAKKNKKKKKGKAQDEGYTGYRLSLLAMPKDMVAAYRSFAHKCGLELKDIDYNGNSLFQAMRKECAQDVQALIKVNERRTQVLILVDGNVVMSRFVPYGIDEAVAEVYDEGLVLPGASYDEAINLLQTTHTLTPAQAGSFSELISGILKVLELYESQNPERQIDRIVLVGLGGTINSFCNLLTQEIGMDVDIMTDLPGFHIPRDEKNNDLGEYVSCLGAVLSPANFFTEERKAQKAFGVDVNDITRLAMIILVLLAVALVAIGALGYITERGKNATLKARFRNYSAMLTSYQEYTLSKQAAQYMQDAFDATQLPTGTLVEFIEELEEKMPANLYVSSFIADREKVTVSVTAPTKEEAADAIIQFRTFESLSEVTVSGITDSGTGGGGVTFTMVGTYKQNETENKAAEPPAQEGAEAAEEERLTVRVNDSDTGE